jgi:hypothetical protein
MTTLRLLAVLACVLTITACATHKKADCCANGTCTDTGHKHK